MNIFTEVLFLFVFVYALIILKLPDMTKDDYIFQKFSIFVSLFCFYFVLQALNTLRCNSMVSMSDLVKNSFIVAISGVLGLTVYTDLLNMEWSHDYIEQYIPPNSPKYIFSLVVTISIILFIAGVRILQMVLSAQNQ
ncbi:MAG: hypothetical protein Terrestrivirus3_2 [Terrestrivirus sp.]|uniref:Uncharacterized protein n=1 Tax=Terrestrivirus sp. TaxID=2487775 RepID=A0A3G4ZQ45_9VIRU|nr:MAG: hypothetical protein Terrestrivirus3_2 [Terrestrivirus sp.]